MHKAHILLTHCHLHELDFQDDREKYVHSSETLFCVINQNENSTLSNSGMKMQEIYLKL